MHDGQFKTDLKKGWINIKGEEYFTTQKPGLVWKGTTRMFTARDMYIADKGRLIVSVLSLFKVVNGKGEKYNQGELLRWLSESVWFPTNLLPSENLQVLWRLKEGDFSYAKFNVKKIEYDQPKKI